MKQRIWLLIQYYVFFVLLSVLGKPLFVFSTLRVQPEGIVSELPAIMWHGLPLDLGVAGYVTALFGLMLVGSCVWHRTRVLTRMASVYTGLIMWVWMLITVVDIGLYPEWMFRLDRTVFTYLGSPREVLACAPWYIWIAGVVAWGLLSVGVYLLWRRWMRPQLELLTPIHWGYTPLMLLVTALLFIPVRGGFTVATLNTGRVFYSASLPVNQAAVQPAFNLLESLDHATFDYDHYRYMSSGEADSIVGQMVSDTTAVRTPLLRVERPNIFLVILEGYTANAIGALGARESATPCLDRLCEEGVLFSRCYSGSFRTDRGLVCVLSGFPGQPTSSLMKVPAKSQHLPQISQELLDAGYHTRFYYGGDETFVSMRSYLVAGGYQDRVSEDDFTPRERNSKWGVHDHILLNRVWQTHREVPSPYMQTILTLSSHEPFEVPASRRHAHPVPNAMAYTDSCIGAFVEQLRATPEWDSTLVIFVADHGYAYPDGVNYQDVRRYHIPMLWVGGAIAAPRRIDKVCSQMDLAATLLAQLGLKHDRYPFSRDVMRWGSESHDAYFSFVDGFGLVTDRDTLVYDAKADRLVYSSDTTGSLLYRSQAWTQRMYEQIAALSAQ